MGASCRDPFSTQYRPPSESARGVAPTTANAPRALPAGRYPLPATAPMTSGPTRPSLGVARAAVMRGKEEREQRRPRETAWGRAVGERRGTGRDRSGRVRRVWLVGNGRPQPARHFFRGADGSARWLLRPADLWDRQVVDGVGRERASGARCARGKFTGRRKKSA